MQGAGLACCFSSSLSAASQSSPAPTTETGLRNDATMHSHARLAPQPRCGARGRNTGPTAIAAPSQPSQMALARRRCRPRLPRGQRAWARCDRRSTRGHRLLLGGGGSGVPPRDTSAKQCGLDDSTSARICMPRRDTLPLKLPFRYLWRGARV